MRLQRIRFQSYAQNGIFATVFLSLSFSPNSCFFIRPYALEVLLAPYETEARLRVHIALDVESGSETLGTAEEDTCLGGCVNLADGLENHVPVWSTKVGWRTETGNGVLLGICIVDHNVSGIVCFDLGSEVLEG